MSRGPRREPTAEVSDPQRHVRGPGQRRHLRLRRPDADGRISGCGDPARSAAGGTRLMTGSAQLIPDFTDVITKVVIHRGEITFHVERQHLPTLVQHLRDDASPAVRVLQQRLGRALPGR